MQISVMLGNLGQPFEQALDTVQSLGIPAVQLGVSADDDSARRQQMLKEVQSRGLAVSAICVDAGDLGEADKGEERVAAIRPLLEAAVEIGNGICQTHVGIMPHTMSGPRWESFLKYAGAIASDAEKIGACLALETGPEPARVMENLITTIGSPGLRVNYDPANFIIWPAVLTNGTEYSDQTGVPPKPYDREAAIAEFEPTEGVKRLGPYIVHTHAKDATAHNGWQDVPLGEGWVDWPRYLRLLREAGYDGYLTIEREGGEDRVGDVRHAAEFLREQLKQLEQDQ
jgi:L-ribulose-5-phosphate 3-epimerase